ncbi:MAG: hypothetical protein JNJ73_19195 [Hyphomonadaceae bacterium]|nr:hypothetical protein [Hyphomonadaceae bacterium]
MRAKAGQSVSEGLGPQEIDRLHVFAEITDQTLMALVARIERSSTAEHLIYRECELDEAWRLLDSAVREVRSQGGAGAAEALETLDALRPIVIKAHDLVGIDGDVKSAASELRQGVLLARKWVNLQKR